MFTVYCTPQSFILHISQVLSKQAAKSIMAGFSFWKLCATFTACQTIFIWMGFLIRSLFYWLLCCRMLICCIVCDYLLMFSGLENVGELIASIFVLSCLYHALMFSLEIMKKQCIIRNTWCRSVCFCPTAGVLVQIHKWVNSLLTFIISNCEAKWWFTLTLLPGLLLRCGCIDSGVTLLTMIHLKLVRTYFRLM